MYCSALRFGCITFAFLLEVCSGASVQAETSDPQDAFECTEESGCKQRQTSLLQTKSQTGETLLVEEEEEDAISDDESDRIELVDSQTATEREQQRTKLMLERDLSKLHASHYRMWNPSESCTANANNAFEHLMEKLGDTQMTAEEKKHFKLRFVSEMEHDCKVDSEIEKHWQDDVALASEHEKPAVTEALAQSINGANLGYKVKMAKWLLTESANSFSLRQGKTRDPAENHTMFLQTQKHLADHAASGKVVQLPSAFNSASKWPTCSNIIKKAHNQGVCGSCWAFGAAGTLDSRICIATNGQFQAQVSRGYAASCKSGDGCKGGLARHAYALAGGIPTGGNTGCSPYFGHGEGTDHFQQQSSAPPCPESCHNPNGYPRTMSADKFNLPSLTYREIWPTNAQGNRMAKESMMAHGPLSFGVMASGSGFSGYSSGILQNGCNPNPNHEVYAYGWGRNTFLGMNSWGSHWGNNGGFEIAECSVTDWTIVGDIRADVSGLPLPLPGASGPSPAPPGPSAGSNPAPAPQAGGTWNVVSGKCVKDSQGCISSTNYPRDYPNRDRCTIRPDPGFGQIEVVDFNTENKYDKLIVNRYGISGSGHNTVPSLHHDLVPTGDIKWRSDSSEVMTGWKLCPRNRPAPATPAPTPVPATPAPTPEPVPATPAPTPVQTTAAPASEWTVTGPCPVVGNCVTSSNYPAAYNTGEACTITAWPASGVTLESFDTEDLWDSLQINGLAISGSHGRKQGISVTSQITWTSDGATTKRGWKLCR